MAQAGFVGSLDPLSGIFGFLNAYSGLTDSSPLNENLGESYLIEKNAIKMHCACGATLTAIDALISILSEESLPFNHIDSVTVGMNSAAHSYVCIPEDSKMNPLSVADAQMSLPYIIATVCHYGSITANDYTDEKINDSITRSLMPKVTGYIEPEFDVKHLDYWPSKVTITLKDKRKFEKTIIIPKGYPEEPITFSEEVDKFRKLCNGLLSSKVQQEIIDRVEKFENEQNIQEFLELTISFIETVRD